jgi:hypothetical protein
VLLVQPGGRRYGSFRDERRHQVVRPCGSTPRACGLHEHREQTQCMVRRTVFHSFLIVSIDRNLARRHSRTNRRQGERSQIHGPITSPLQQRRHGGHEHRRTASFHRSRSLVPPLIGSVVPVQCLRSRRRDRPRPRNWADGAAKRCPPSLAPYPATVCLRIRASTSAICVRIKGHGDVLYSRGGHSQ